MKRLLFLLSLTMLTACQSAPSNASEPVSAGGLAKEFETSSAGVRRKYDGKEIIVVGYTTVGVALPESGDDQGSLLLEGRGGDHSRAVTCWFSRDQVADFSKLKRGQDVTVKGVFNGEAGANLKFCRLVKVE